MIEQTVVAIVQGITEFFPISSDGHILITEWLFNIKPDLFGIIWLHVASLSAILVVYWKDMLHVLHGFFQFVFHKKQKDDFVFAIKLGVTTIITAVTAFVLLDFITKSLESIRFIGAMIFMNGVVIFLGDYFSRHVSQKKFSWIDVPIVGVLQGLAALPGVSRSGTTTSYLMGAGVKRLEALRISFLLAIPAIVGAFVLTASTTVDSVEKIFSITYGILFIVTFLVSLIAIKVLKKLVQKYWVWFVPYCVVVGSILMVLG